MENFSIKIGDFEGPLDLLLNLIEKRKLHISQVSLSNVTDEYISYIKRLENLSKENIANFILIASTLMLIKSTALLPTLTLTTEEQENVSDLERRLKLYQEIKRLSLYVSERFGKQIIYQKIPTKNIEPIFTPTAEVSIGSICQAIKNVINSLPKKEIIPKVLVKKVISLEEVIGNLTNRIQSAMRMKFSDFVGPSKADKFSVVVSFLGMLELVKNGIIEVKQDELFTDIEMENRNITTPRYT